jgi:hypothetical protein
LLGPLEIALILAALLIGATGTFSPCGLSVIETFGPGGHTGGRRTTLAACATFLPGSVIGGVLTFGSLAMLGGLVHGVGDRPAVLGAAALAGVAAVLDARGTRIVPQIRRQLPEHWRRLMPMPLAAALYGVLLGIGFTTFVLSFGVWALAGISLAIGDPWLGLLLGLSFGVGRAIPIVVLAPLAGEPPGIRARELMCERPSVYLGLRRSDAAALALVALALVVVPVSAGAADDVAVNATDPSATEDALAFESVSGAGVLRSGGVDTGLPGGDPAIGGSYVATLLDDDVVRLLSRFTLQPVAEIEAPGADALAVSDFWLAFRAPLPGGGDGMFARSIRNPGIPGPVQTLNTVGGGSQFSPPSLDGATLLYGVATPIGSSIVEHVLGINSTRTLVSSGRLLLFDPAIRGDDFVYTRTDARHSRLMLAARGGRGPGKVLLKVRRAIALVWSTALTGDFAYATLLNAQGADARIIRVSRREGKRLGRRRAPRGAGNHKY